MSTFEAKSIDAGAILRERGEQVERALRAILVRQHDGPPRLIEAIEYSLIAGGKRLRPALVLEWHAAISGSTEPDASALAGMWHSRADAMLDSCSKR